MRRVAFLLVFAITGPLAAQELGLHGSSAVPRDGGELFHGMGVSAGVTFRLGDILADTAWARRANLQLGLRLSFTGMTYRERLLHLCVDDCPRNAHDVSLVSRHIQSSLFVLPYVSRTLRLEANGGVTSYRDRRTSDAFGYSWRDRYWGFVAGGAMSRRFRVTSPLWLNLGYTWHGGASNPRSDPSYTTPRHSFRAGVIYRVATEERCRETGRNC